MATTATEREPLTDSLTPGVKTGPVIAALAAAGIAVSMAQTLVIPIIGALPEMLNTTPGDASWALTATLLTGAVSTPVLGRLADMYGKKKIMLIALIPFVIGSIVCALSFSVIPMIIGRGLQGLATGMIPVGISLLHDVLPREKVGSAVALMSSSLGVGGALGLPVSAAVIQVADWRVLFWAMAVVGVLVLAAIWRLVPVREPAGHEHGFDYVGTIGLAVGLVGLLLAVSKGSEWGWNAPVTLSLLIGAVVVLLLWGWWELRRRGPLVDLRATAKPVVALTNLASLMIGFSMYVQSLVLPQIMQLPEATGYGFGLTVLIMGLLMAPAGLAMMLVSSPGAASTRRWGAKVTLVVGALAMAIGYAGSAMSTGTLWGLVLASVLTSAGTGFAFGSMPALIMANVPAREKAASNGFNSLMRALGTTVAAAVIGGILAAMTQPMGERQVPTESAFITSLLIGCAISVVAAIIAAAVPGGPVRDAGKH